MKKRKTKVCKNHCYHLPHVTVTTWPPGYHNEATCCHCGRRESEDHGPHHPAKQQPSYGTTWVYGSNTTDETAATVVRTLRSNLS